MTPQTQPPVYAFRPTRKALGILVGALIFMGSFAGICDAPTDQSYASGNLPSVMGNVNQQSAPEPTATVEWVGACGPITIPVCASVATAIAGGH